jgi:N-acetylmuramoyl-L-alanine amidase
MRAAGRTRGGRSTGRLRRSWPGRSGRLALLVLLLLAGVAPLPAAREPARELLVEGLAGPAILPSWSLDGRRLFALEDLLRLAPLSARSRGTLHELFAGGHTCRVLAGARFAWLDGSWLQLPGPPQESDEGLLLDMELLGALLAGGFLQGELDLVAGRLRLAGGGAALRRDELPGGDLLRLRLPEIPVFESRPGEGRVDLLLPARGAVQELHGADLGALAGEGLIRGLDLGAEGAQQRLRVQLAPEAELLEVVEVEALGEIQLVLRRRGGPVASGLFADEPAPRLSEPTRRLRLERIVIDPGHGGKDPGAVAPSGRYEKTVVLAVSRLLREELARRAPDLEVLMTREDDRFLSLEERTALANRAEGQLFLSIHANAAKDRRARGYEVFFLRPGRNQHARQVALRENTALGMGSGGPARPEDWILASMAQSAWVEESQNLAVLLAEELAQAGRPRRRSVLQAGFQVLVGASMPAVLVECGFLTHAEEERQLASTEGQRKMAKAIADAVLRFRELYSE